MTVSDSPRSRFRRGFLRVEGVVGRARHGGVALLVAMSGLIGAAFWASPILAGQPPSVDPSVNDDPSAEPATRSRPASRASRFPNTPIGVGASSSRTDAPNSSVDETGLDSSSRIPRSRGSKDRGRFRDVEPELGSRSGDTSLSDPLRRPRVGLGTAVARQRLGLPEVAAGPPDAPSARSGASAIRSGEASSSVSDEFWDRAARYRANLRDRALRERDPTRRAEWVRRLREFDAKLREVLEARRSNEVEERSDPDANAPTGTDRRGGGTPGQAPTTRSATPPSPARLPRRPAPDASGAADAEPTRTPAVDLPSALPPTPRRG